MCYVFVDAWMPNGDYIEARYLYRRLKHSQARIALSKQARRNERHKIVCLQDVWHQQETWYRVADVPAQPEAFECPVGWTLEGATSRRHQNVIVAEEAIRCQGLQACKRMPSTNGDDVSFAIEQT